MPVPKYGVLVGSVSERQLASGSSNHYEIHVKAAGVLSTPRPLPNRIIPMVAGGALMLLALPIFAIAGWRMSAWALAAVLWAASQGLGLVLGRLRVGMANLAGSGVVAFGMMFRAIAVMVVLVAVAVSHPSLAVGAALLYALAYTLEFGVSLVSYFGGQER